MTNAEKIRSMADKELAEFLESIETYSDFYGEPLIGFYLNDEYVEIGANTGNIMNWLKSEVEE